jgi:transcriptional regulator, AraC family
VAPLRREADWVFATRDTPKPMPVAFHHGVVEVGSLSDAEIDTELMCGFLGCDAKPFNPLLAALPRLLHLPSLQAATGRRGRSVWRSTNRTRRAPASARCSNASPK